MACNTNQVEPAHVFLRGLRTAPQALLRLIRQRWRVENEWHRVRAVPLGEDAHRCANRIGACPCVFLPAQDISQMLALGGVRAA